MTMNAGQGRGRPPGGPGGTGTTAPGPASAAGGGGQPHRTSGDIDITTDQRRNLPGSSSGFAQRPRRAPARVDALDGRGPRKLDFVVLERSEDRPIPRGQRHIDRWVTKVVP